MYPLITNIIFLKVVLLAIKYPLLKTLCVLHSLVSCRTNMSSFHPLEVVGRGSETQLQVGENLIYIKRGGRVVNIKGQNREQ